MVYVIYVMMNTNKYFILLFLILNNFVFGIKEIKLNTPQLESKISKLQKKSPCSPDGKERSKGSSWARYAMNKEMIIKATPKLNTYHIIIQHQNGHREIIGEAFDNKMSPNKSIDLTWFRESGNMKTTLQYKEKK